MINQLLELLKQLISLIMKWLGVSPQPEPEEEEEQPEPEEEQPEEEDAPGESEEEESDEVPETHYLMYNKNKAFISDDNTSVLWKLTDGQ